MDLFQAMGVYVKVVELGSMTAAARACDLSTTMVSNHLQALEQRLGVSLLLRTTRRQQVTEAGQAYYLRCLEVLGLVADSERWAERTQATPQGLLRITAPPTFGAECLTPALSGFLQRYPQISVSLTLSDQVQDMLEGHFDAALRLGALEPSTLIARPLDDYRLSICASPEYLQRCGTPQRPEELSAYECLQFMYNPGDAWRGTEKRWSMRGPEGFISVEVAGRLVTNSSAGLRQAALAGMGLVMLPDVLLKADLQAGTLVRVLAPFALPGRPLHLLYPQDRYRSPKLRAFVDYIVQMLGPAAGSGQ